VPNGCRSYAPTQKLLGALSSVGGGRNINFLENLGSTYLQEVSFGNTSHGLVLARKLVLGIIRVMRPIGAAAVAVRKPEGVVRATRLLLCRKQGTSLVLM